MAVATIINSNDVTLIIRNDNVTLIIADGGHSSPKPSAFPLCTSSGLREVPGMGGTEQNTDIPSPQGQAIPTFSAWIVSQGSQRAVIQAPDPEPCPEEVERASWRQRHQSPDLRMEGGIWGDGEQ